MGMDEKLNCVNLQMLRASHVVMKAYDDAYRPFGLRATQVPVLSILAGQGRASIQDIAQATASERSVMSRKLAVMQKNGWIQAAGVSASREKQFSLTDDGHALLSRLAPVRLQVQEKLLARLSREEQQLLLGLYEKLQD